MVVWDGVDLVRLLLESLIKLPPRDLLLKCRVCLLDPVCRWEGLRGRVCCRVFRGFSMRRTERREILGRGWWLCLMVRFGNGHVLALDRSAAFVAR